MVVMLDGSGTLQSQLLRALKTSLLEGGFGHGARLPATRELARQLGLSRNTVTAVYEQLRVEGYIEARVGAGSFATVPAPPPALPRPAATGVPPTAYARRARACFDLQDLPGRAVPGMRHAFQYGAPMTHPGLADAWARALSHAAHYTAPHYGATQGLPALRSAICDYLARRRGVHAAPEDVLVVAGTQQALALTARVLLEPGDGAVIEEPHYNAIRVGLQVHGAHVHAVPVDAEGLRVDAIPATDARVAFVTPSHQFPTGAVMSLRRRMALLEWASASDAWIWEDDYDGEFRHDGAPLTALHALDRDGRVLYVGSFSKALFPALRLGYMVLPARLRRDFVAAKWMADFGSPAIEQAALAHFMASGAFERHLRRTALELRRRRTALVEGLRRCSRGRLELGDAHAGMHLVLRLREGGREGAEALILLARARGLALYSMAPYYLDPPDRGELLMGYAALTVAEIEDALGVFERCLDELWPAARAVQAGRSSRG
jgi:GntR family transcriptional regulator/MocR family aminotransferase